MDLTENYWDGSIVHFEPEEDKDMVYPVRETPPEVEAEKRSVSA